MALASQRSALPARAGQPAQARRAVVAGAAWSGWVRSMLSGTAEQQQLLLPRVEVELARPPQPLAHPFRVATFNILADGLAQSGDFVKVPVSCLAWEHRLPLILAEIAAADADIVALQELNHFDVLAAALIPQGYSCFFRAKQPSPALKFGFPADGIALFYRHSRFSCNPAPAGHCFESMDGQAAPQGFVTAQLLDKQAGRHILVAATHLKAKPGADNEQTRVHQASQLLCELEHMQERHLQLQLQQQPPPGAAGNGTRAVAAEPAAVLVCGDFNTTPDSDTVRAMTSHALGLGSLWDVRWADSGRDARAACGGNGHGNGASSSARPGAVPTNGNSKHKPQPARTQPAQAEPKQQPVQAQQQQAQQQQAQQQQQQRQQQQHQQQAQQQQAQAPQGPQGAQPPPAREGREFTTWKFRSSGVAQRSIDYILYSSAQLAPLSRWRMLSEEEIGPQGLPNSRYPSDHMCVVAQFGWLPVQQPGGEQQEQGDVPAP